MKAAERLFRNPNIIDLGSRNSSKMGSGEYGIQVKRRVYRTLIVCDDVMDAEQADKRLRSLGAEPETIPGPTIPSSIRQELTGDSEASLWIPQPIIVTRQGFRTLRSDFGDSE